MLILHWNELASIKRELAVRDWFPGTSGNLSIKVQDEPLQCLVTVSGKDKYKETNEDFVLVNEDAEPLTDEGKPSAETVIHLEVYKKTDAGCSLHVHTLDNNLISELYFEQGFITFKGVELIKAFGIWAEDGQLTIPIVENYSDLPTLGKAISHVIEPDTKAVLIRNHGITVWGRNAFEAKRHLEACEFLFSYQMKLLHAKAANLKEVIKNGSY
ncbi:methylthioribulose 1-phosphate dehydratase [Halalkalibacter sp. APA_J-10(15)]|uniref:methylthioribulose 1-phosphate dehydratase n=1 Tax=unclassified Halalkalibacter TaxID=2893063 RepID=UPI001FF63D62|nr:methylthioribulose 1-phosphate dehydratase [Halalkalibacter sp. APA_J-10(15)]MCK0473162.1 methylthioribulose 1-phosphate dehydratase [Halalkalibacter sp. APA_J-10(15)]